MDDPGILELPSIPNQIGVMINDGAHCYQCHPPHLEGNDRAGGGRCMPVAQGRL